MFPYSCNTLYNEVLLYFHNNLYIEVIPFLYKTLYIKVNPYFYNIQHPLRCFHDFYNTLYIKVILQCYKAQCIELMQYLYNSKYTEMWWSYTFINFCISGDSILLWNPICCCFLYFSTLCMLRLFLTLIPPCVLRWYHSFTKP